MGFTLLLSGLLDKRDEEQSVNSYVSVRKCCRGVQELYKSLRSEEGEVRESLLIGVSRRSKYKQSVVLTKSD